MALKRSSRKRLLKILWARIAAATVIHALVSGIIFELCSLSASSVFALDKHQFTILRLRETLMVVFAQCLPIFVRIGLGQNLNPRSWGLLRVDTALRPPLVTNLRVYGIQLLSSSIAALVLASQLSSAIGLNKDYYQGVAAATGGEDPADAATNDAASLPPSASAPLNGAALAEELRERGARLAQRLACAAARAALGNAADLLNGEASSEEGASFVANGTYPNGTVFEGVNCGEFSAENNNGGGVGTFTNTRSWWHDEFVLLAAVAAVIADTARSVRRREHDVSFPVLASGPERTLLGSTLHSLPALVLAAAKSASQWLLLVASCMHVGAPLACRALLFGVQHAAAHASTLSEATGLPVSLALAAGGRLAAVPLEVAARAMGWRGGTVLASAAHQAASNSNSFFSPSFYASFLFSSTSAATDSAAAAAAEHTTSSWAGLTVLHDVAFEHRELLALPWAVWWRAFVVYSATYLLLSHGVAVLKRLLATPLDFNYAAGFGPTAGATAAASSPSSSSVSALFDQQQQQQPAGMGSGVNPGGGGDGGVAGVVRLGADGNAASSLLVGTMAIGWRQPLLDREDALAEEEFNFNTYFNFNNGGSSNGCDGGGSGSASGAGGLGGHGDDGDMAMGSLKGAGACATNGSLSTSSSTSSSTSDLAWVRELNAQRFALSQLCDRVLTRETTLQSQGGRGLWGGLTRLVRDFLHCGWLGVDRGRSMPPPLRLPYFEEQDSGVSVLDAAARALAFQHAADSAWCGGRLRRDLYAHGTWRQLVSVCCLHVDTATLQLQAVLANNMRINAHFTENGNLGGATDLYRDNQTEVAGGGSREWVAANLVGNLLASHASTRGQKYDRITARMVNAVLAFCVPRPLRAVGRILADPLPPRLSSSALQVLMWGIEALSRVVAFGAADECPEVAATALPLALTSLLSLQLTLEQVGMECPLNSVQGRAGHQQMLPEYESLSLVLETAVTLLVRSSGDALPAFSFPPLYARRLQAYVNQSS